MAETCPKCGAVGSLMAASTVPGSVWTKRICSCGVLYSYENGQLKDYKLPKDYKGRRVEAKAIVEVKLGGP